MNCNQCKHKNCWDCNIYAEALIQYEARLSNEDYNMREMCEVYNLYD